MPKRLSPRLVRRRKRTLWGVFFLLAAGTMAWAVFLTPTFAIKNVIVATRGRSTIAPEEIQTVLHTLQSSRSNILFLSPRAWERRFEERFPQLKHATVNRVILRLPFLGGRAGLVNEVRLNLEEREPLGTMCKERDSARVCFLFDSDGVLFQEQASSTPFVLDKRNIEYRLGYRVLNPETASRLAETAMRTLAGLAPLRLELTNIETMFVTPEGWYLILANDRPLEEQFSAARIVLEREVGQKRPMLEYIDATIKNRAYYRYRLGM